MMRELMVAFVAFGASCTLTAVLVRVLLWRNILDKPNARSSHSSPTPRGGGLAILLGLLVALALARLVGLPTVSVPILLGTALVAIVGAVDDLLGGVPPFARLMVQTAAALLVVLSRGGFTVLPLPHPFDIPLGEFGTALAILWMVALCNFYNFLDGIDGYAATQGMLAGMGFFLLGHEPLAATALAIVGACLGFLVYNWHPARIFMGDIGSGSVGFLLAALPFALPAGSRESSVFAAGLFLWFFLSDGLFTLFSRLLDGQKIWTAHRRHLYQRLVATGIPHSTVVVGIGLAALTLISFAVISCRLHEALLQWTALLVAVLSFVAYFVGTRMWEDRGRSRIRKV